MTPLSSLLEACNVGHMNNGKFHKCIHLFAAKIRSLISIIAEPLMLRWTRGLIPRCARESKYLAVQHSS